METIGLDSDRNLMNSAEFNEDKEIHKLHSALMFDIMGQKIATKEVDKLVRSDLPLVEKSILYKSLKSTNQFIDSIYDTCEMIVSDHNNRSETYNEAINNNSALTDYHKALFKRALQPQITQTQFSDTYVLSFPMSFHDKMFSELNEKNKSMLSSLYTMLNFVVIFDVACSVMIKSILNKSPVRGGLARGEGIITKRTSTLYGQVLANAYYLEDTVAVYPRYVVSTEIVDIIKKTKEDSKGSKLYYIIKEHINLLEEAIVLDDDGLYVIDYVVMYTRKSNPKEELINCYNIVTDEVDKYRVENNIKLLSKYSRLQTFLKNRILNYFDAEFDLTSQKLLKIIHRV